MFKNPEFAFGILRYTGKWLQNLSNHKTICNFLFSIAWVFLYISVVYIAYLWLSISILEIVIAYSNKLPILNLFPWIRVLLLAKQLLIKSYILKLVSVNWPPSWVDWDHLNYFLILFQNVILLKYLQFTECNHVKRYVYLKLTVA